MPYRITYSGTRSGLQDVAAHVTKPDGTDDGIFHLVEFESPLLTGRYYFDLSTSIYDPAGQYTILVMSPTEGHTELVSRGLYAATGGAAPMNPNELRIDLLGIVSSGGLLGYVETKNDVLALMDMNSLSGKVNLTAEIFGTVEADYVQGNL